MALDLCLKLFSVGTLHLKHTLGAMATKICIPLNNQTNMDCYFIGTCFVIVSKYASVASLRLIC